MFGEGVMQAGGDVVGERHGFCLTVNFYCLANRVDNHAAVLATAQMQLQIGDNFLPEITVEGTGKLANDLPAFHASDLRLKKGVKLPRSLRRALSSRDF